MLHIVAVTGMPGAGKSTATLALAEKGWTRFVMGDVIRAETERRGYEPDAKNTGVVMKQLRDENGPSAVADLCLEAIEKSHSQKVVVDGVRSMAEVDAFRNRADVILVAVHASPARRFEFLRERGRKDDPLTFEMFQARDKRELGVGIGESISMADEVISNERTSPGRLANEMVRVAERWMKNARS